MDDLRRYNLRETTSTLFQHSYQVIGNMKLSSWLIRLIVSALIFICATSEAKPHRADSELSSRSSMLVFDRDPIGLVAHGGVFDFNMKPITPDKEFITHSVNFYLHQLSAQADKKTLSQLAKHQELLADRLKGDEITQNFLLLDYLIYAVSPDNSPYLEARSYALKRHWYKTVLKLKNYKEVIDKRTALPKDLTKFGLENNLLYKATSAAGVDYIKECDKAEVPIPPTWGKDGWDYVGNLTTNLLNLGDPVEVWRADSTNPKGLCVALPRIDPSDSDNISALGIICLGTESSNACFYDASDVPVNATMEAKDFISGADLFNGVCTDCHAGENPYIVHPGGPLNMFPDNMPASWHTPLIKPSWPQNPGPFGLLDNVSIDPAPPANEESCLDCHYQGYAGRFPNVLALNQWAEQAPGNAYVDGTSEYCDVILEGALNNTMPGPGSAHDTHVKAMKAFCNQTPPKQEEEPTPNVDDNPDTLSPPIVLGPLFACASAIEVKGGVYGAELKVFIDGNAEALVTVTQPSSTIVTVPSLVKGQVVTAIQSIQGSVSDISDPVTVIEHKEIYENGLPAPSIDPQLVHECGMTIAVRHVRGAKVTVFTNSGDPVTYSSGGDWTNIPPKIRPFNLGDKYTAQQSLCDDSSAISSQVAAVAAPSPMPLPVMDPAAPFVGQQLLKMTNLAHGATTVVSESAAGDIAKLITAVSWHNELDIATQLGGPIQVGHSLGVVSALCKDTKLSIPEPIPCKEMGAPRIATPFVGQEVAYVTDAVPGARVLIYDDSLIEIGDGSGDQIQLTRAILPGDILHVIQKLGECTSDTAFRTGVLCVDEENCK